MQQIIDRTEELGRAVVARVRDQRGQISAEFMGLLFIVALIIGAIVAFNIHDTIAKAVDEFIRNIKSGDSPEGG